MTIPIPATEAPVDRKILNTLETKFGQRLVEKSEVAHINPRLKEALGGDIPDAMVFLDDARQLPLIVVEVKKKNLIAEAEADCLEYCKKLLGNGMHVPFALAACATETTLWYFDAEAESLLPIEEENSGMAPRVRYNPALDKLDAEILSELYYTNSSIISQQNTDSLNTDQVIKFCVDANSSLQDLAFQESDRARLLTTFLLSCLNTDFNPGETYRKFSTQTDEAQRRDLITLLNNQITQVCEGRYLRTRADSHARVSEPLNVNASRFHIQSVKDLEGVLVFIKYGLESGPADASSFFDKLLNSSNILGDAYEVFHTYTGGNSIGQYFTPRHVVDFSIYLVERLRRQKISPDDIIYDPACGVGGFLALAMKHATAGLTGAELAEAYAKIGKNLYGNDLEERAADLAKVNLFLRGDGKSGIVVGSALDKHSVDQDGNLVPSPIKKKLDSVQKEPTICLMNPPFPTKTSDYKSFEFVEHAVDVAANNAYIAAVVPISVINGEDSRTKPNPNKSFRRGILQTCQLKAVVSFPPDLFQPRAGVDTALIVLQKTGLPHDNSHSVVLMECKSDGMEMHKGSKIRQEKQGIPNELRLALHSWLPSEKHQIVRKFARIPLDLTKGQDWSPSEYIQDDPYEYSDTEINRLARRIAQEYESSLLPMKEGSKW